MILILTAQPTIHGMRTTRVSSKTNWMLSTCLSYTGKRSGEVTVLVVDGPVVEWKGDKMIYTYVYNRIDDGKPPRRSSELSAKPAGSQHLEFIFPNLWQNYISEKVSVLAAFVPVDDEHTILYLRFYQRFMQVPLLRKLVARLAMPSNVYIAHEDRRVVITQQPKASGLKIGEILIQGDLPIIEYRRKRAALQNLAEQS